jgi:hypothetical protein
VLQLIANLLFGLPADVIGIILGQISYELLAEFTLFLIGRVSLRTLYKLATNFKNQDDDPWHVRYNMHIDYLKSINKVDYHGLARFKMMNGINDVNFYKNLMEGEVVSCSGTFGLNTGIDLAASLEGLNIKYKNIDFDIRIIAPRRYIKNNLLSSKFSSVSFSLVTSQDTLYAALIKKDKYALYKLDALYFHVYGDCQHIAKVKVEDFELHIDDVCNKILSTSAYDLLDTAFLNLCFYYNGKSSRCFVLSSPKALIYYQNGKLVRFNENEGRASRLIALNDIFEEYDIERVWRGDLDYINSLSPVLKNFIHYEYEGAQSTNLAKAQVNYLSRLIRDEKTYIQELKEITQRDFSSVFSKYSVYTEDNTIKAGEYENIEDAVYPEYKLKNSNPSYKAEYSEYKEVKGNNDLSHKARSEASSEYKAFSLYKEDDIIQSSVSSAYKDSVYEIDKMRQSSEYTASKEALYTEDSDAGFKGSAMFYEPSLFDKRAESEPLKKDEKAEGSGVMVLSSWNKEESLYKENKMKSQLLDLANNEGFYVNEPVADSVIVLNKNKIKRVKEADLSDLHTNKMTAVMIDTELLKNLYEWIEIKDGDIKAIPLDLLVADKRKEVQKDIKKEKDNTAPLIEKIKNEADEIIGHDILSYTDNLSAKVKTLNPDEPTTLLFNDLTLMIDVLLNVFKADQHTAIVANTCNMLLETKFDSFIKVSQVNRKLRVDLEIVREQLASTGKLLTNSENLAKENLAKNQELVKQLENAKKGVSEVHYPKYSELTEGLKKNLTWRATMAYRGKIKADVLSTRFKMDVEEYNVLGAEMVKLMVKMIETKGLDHDSFNVADYWTKFDILQKALMQSQAYKIILHGNFLHLNPILIEVKKSFNIPIIVQIMLVYNQFE